MYGHRWIVLATRLHGVEADTAVNRGAAKGGVYIGRGGSLSGWPRRTAPRAGEEVNR